MNLPCFRRKTQRILYVKKCMSEANKDYEKAFKEICQKLKLKN